ncbi:hypothetical protein [Flavobacterium sp.]|uniref:hypothetical protein n=1 Tax=Flavobacterium sp. TaxID=239 RepID=UPI00286D6B9D|nr:hypothetical protein [Flavobacterium sp.]
MLKNILKLNGAQQLSKNEQKSINGGLRACGPGGTCGAGFCCSGSVCYRYGTPGHLCNPPGLELGE